MIYFVHILSQVKLFYLFLYTWLPTTDKTLENLLIFLPHIHGFLQAAAVCMILYIVKFNTIKMSSRINTKFLLQIFKIE